MSGLSGNSTQRRGHKIFLMTQKNNMQLDGAIQKYLETILRNASLPVSRVLAMDESIAFKCAQREDIVIIQPFKAPFSHHW